LIIVGKRGAILLPKRVAGRLAAKLVPVKRTKLPTKAAVSSHPITSNANFVAICGLPKLKKKKDEAIKKKHSAVPNR
jgi:hypothetical protein